MYRIIIKFIKIYFRRKACQKIINDIDKDFFTQQKKVSSHNSKLIKDGYLKIENFLSADEVDDLIKHKDKEKNELLAITLPILKKLEKKVSNTILGYLGKNVSIHNLQFHKVTSAFQDNVSKNFHTDNLGNKLNCFIILNENNIPTVLKKNSHKKKYKSSMFEDLRIFIKNIKLDKKENLPEIELLGNKGDLIIFDGNALHRGKYENIKGSERISLNFSFINLEKILKMGYQKKLTFFGVHIKSCPFEINYNKLLEVSLQDRQNLRNIWFFKKELFINKDNKLFYYG